MRYSIHSSRLFHQEQKGLCLQPGTHCFYDLVVSSESSPFSGNQSEQEQGCTEGAVRPNADTSVRLLSDFHKRALKECRKRANSSSVYGAHPRTLSNDVSTFPKDSSSLSGSIKMPGRVRCMKYWEEYQERRFQTNSLKYCAAWAPEPHQRTRRRGISGWILCLLSKISRVKS